MQTFYVICRRLKCNCLYTLAIFVCLFSISCASISCAMVHLPPDNNIYYAFVGTPLYEKVKKDPGHYKNDLLFRIEAGYCTRNEALVYLKRHGFKQRESNFDDRLLFCRSIKNGTDKINVWLFKDKWTRWNGSRINKLKHQAGLGKDL